MSSPSGVRASVRYEPSDKISWPLALGLGFQQALLFAASVVISVMVVIRIAGAESGYALWASFAALLVSGISTILQATRFGRVGSGYVLLMGTTGVFIAVSAEALKVGGPGVHAALVLVSALSQFLLAWYMPYLRRFITSSVFGTIIMLIAVTLVPIAFDLAKRVPPEAAANASSIILGVTLLGMVVVVLCAQGLLRLWGPLLGIVLGCLVSLYYGVYDWKGIVAAPWVGLPPLGQWPGFEFGQSFWILLPSFIFATLVGAIETIGDGIAIQQVSWRKPRPVDYKAVQGMVMADGVGNALAGLFGSVPNTTYSNSISVTELTGVAARRVGIGIGLVFIILSFSPKVLALLMNIPGPVVAAQIIVLVSSLFILGMKASLRDGLDYRQGLIVGVSFWLGMGMHNKQLFAEQLHSWWGALLQNGMCAGGLFAIVMSALFNVLSTRTARMKTTLAKESWPAMETFLRSFSKRFGLGPQKLCIVAKEVLLSLIGNTDGGGSLTLNVRKSAATLSLEFVAPAGRENLEGQVRALAKEEHCRVSHQQYHGMDMMTVQLDAQWVVTG